MPTSLVLFIIAHFGRSVNNPPLGFKASGRIVSRILRYFPCDATGGNLTTQPALCQAHSTPLFANTGLPDPWACVPIVERKQMPLSVVGGTLYQTLLHLSSPAQSPVNRIPVPLTIKTKHPWPWEAGLDCRLVVNCLLTTGGDYSRISTLVKFRLRDLAPRIHSHPETGTHSTRENIALSGSKKRLYRNSNICQIAIRIRSSPQISVQQADGRIIDKCLHSDIIPVDATKGTMQGGTFCSNSFSWALRLRPHPSSAA